MSLDTIIDAIIRGVRLMRAHLQVDLFGPLTEGQVRVMLADRAKLEPAATDYGNSIVDLLKVLDLDSSLPARLHLATELGYTGPRSDTVMMNEWLHDEVMRKLARREWP